MSKDTPLTNEFFLKEFSFIREQFGNIRDQFGDVHKQFGDMHEQFGNIREQFKNMDTRFARVEKKLNEHDELLEMIASEVSGTQNLLNELAPARKDHETRITRLERGFTKLILKS
jgi:chromosome segregation ATPase